MICCLNFMAADAYFSLNALSKKLVFFLFFSSVCDVPNWTSHMVVIRTRPQAAFLIFAPYSFRKEQKIPLEFGNESLDILSCIYFFLYRQFALKTSILEE